MEAWGSILCGRVPPSSLSFTSPKAIPSFPFLTRKPASTTVAGKKPMFSTSKHSPCHSSLLAGTWVLVVRLHIWFRYTFGMSLSLTLFRLVQTVLITPSNHSFMLMGTGGQSFADVGFLAIKKLQLFPTPPGKKTHPLFRAHGC